MSRGSRSTCRWSRNCAPSSAADPQSVAASLRRDGLLVVLVATEDVTGVLAEEALDALAELLGPLDVDLLHAVRAVGLARHRREARDRRGLLVVVRDVGDQVADHREGAHRRDRD